MAVKASSTITLSFMVDVQATYRYYKLQASTASAPAVPTTATPSGWTDSEPTYTEGSTQTLYTVDKTVFTNDTFLYSAVSKSTSYEAAKAAYNKAVAANTTATNAQTTVNNLQVGGRNLYLGTRDFSGDKWNNLTEWELLDTGDSEYVEYGRRGAWEGLYQEVEVEAGQQYTFSFFAIGSDEDDPIASMNVYTDWDNTSTTPAYIELGSPSTSSRTRYFCTFTANVTGTICPRVENTVESWLQVSALKFEKGNKATDWTPAPEDVDLSVYNAIQNATETAATLVEEGKAQIEESLESYVKSDDFDSYKESVESTFESTSTGLVDQISSAQDGIDKLAINAKEQFETIHKYLDFNFNDKGFVIGDNEGKLKLILDNSRINFVNNGETIGYWDGTNFHTGNIYVDVSERASFGNFAFLPRSDGSLMFLKVGDTNGVQ